MTSIVRFNAAQVRYPAKSINYNVYRRKPNEPIASKYFIQNLLIGIPLKLNKQQYKSTVNNLEKKYSFESLNYLSNRNLQNSLLLTRFAEYSLCSDV